MIKSEADKFGNVGMRFFVPADMLTQCALLGQGCAGKNYCANCHAHRDSRHIPFELRVGKPPIQFSNLSEGSRHA